MKQSDGLISSIEEKVRALIRRFQDLNVKYELLNQEKTQLEKQVSEQEAIIKNLESKIDTLKIVKALESNEGRNEARLKIDEILREIDKCIRLLNR